MGPSDQEPPVSRRVGVLRAHLGGAVPLDASATPPSAAESANPLFAAPCSAADLVDGSTVVLSERLGSGETWDVRRNVHSPKRFLTTFDAPDDHVKTLHDNLETAISRHAQRPCLGWRKIGKDGKTPGPYEWTSYADVGASRTALGSALLHLGVRPGDKVGLYSANCPEWVKLEAACNAYSMPTVPLYDTLGPDAVRYICNHAELKAVGCSAALLPTLLDCLSDCPTVKLVVVYPHWGAPSGAGGGQALAGAAARAAPARLVAMEQLESTGRANLRPHVAPKGTDMATISYTSGTTGVPKGVVLTHENLIANAAGNAVAVSLLPDDVHVSYLPLAHIYERLNLVGMIHAGAGCGFYRGDVLGLLDDILELQPTIFTSVPRLWNRIHDRVKAAVEEGSPVARALFGMAYRSKAAAIEAGDPTGGPMAGLWDRLVFSKVRARIGGRVRIMATGASPISAEVMMFLRVCFGTIIEGYGMTETACLISSTAPDETTIGHVGCPSPACEVKLVDIPEMSYLTTDSPNPRGEVCVRGPIVFKGYYKDPASTREAVDEHGWLHTGDVGTWLPGGRLKIIDRKKNIFKLAQGEYIAPEKIENVYQRCPLVMQAFVHELVAVVVPDPEALEPWARANGFKSADPAALCSDPKLSAAIMEGMRKEGKSAGLKGFEQVAAVHLVPEPFSVENGLLTPTFKLKRPQAKSAFQEAIAAMYARLES